MGMGEPDPELARHGPRGNPGTTVRHRVGDWAWTGIGDWAWTHRCGECASNAAIWLGPALRLWDVGRGPWRGRERAPPIEECATRDVLERL